MRPHSMRRVYKNLCPATISASIMVANMWKNSLKNVESDNNKILYETLLDFFYSETVLTFWISLVHRVGTTWNCLHNKRIQCKSLGMISLRLWQYNPSHIRRSTCQSTYMVASSHSTTCDTIVPRCQPMMTRYIGQDTNLSHWMQSLHLDYTQCSVWTCL